MVEIVVNNENRKLAILLYFDAIPNTSIRAIELRLAFNVKCLVAAKSNFSRKLLTDLNFHLREFLINITTMFRLQLILK